MASFITSAIDAVNRSTYTFSGITFPAGRVVVMARVQAAPGVSWSSATINGVAATIDFDASVNANNPTLWLSAVVSSGTGSVVLNVTGGTANRASIGVWNAVGTAFVAGVQDNSANPCVLNINTQAGDAAFATAYLFGATSYSGTNLTERFDRQIEGSNWDAGYDNLNCTGGTPEAFGITQSGTSGSPFGSLVIYRNTNTDVSLDTPAYTETLNAVTVAVDMPLPLGALSYSETLNDVTVAVDTQVSLGSLSYTQTLENVGVATTVDTPVDLDALGYTETLNDIGVAVDTPVALDGLSYTQTVNDLGVAVDTPVSLDALAYSATIEDVTVATNVVMTLDSLDYAVSLPDVGVSTALRVRRGDDGGERERFWRRKAEEWLEDYLEKLPEVAKKPARTRRRAAKRLLEDAEAMAAQIPPLAPRIDYIAALVRQLAEPRPDYTALATAIAAQMEQVEAEKRARRRKRDLEAVLLLAA